MIADWLSGDGRKARSKMGDPVPDLDDIIYQVSKTEGERALAQERDRAREWLHERCVWLVYEPGLEAWYAIRGYRRNQEERHSGKSAFEELTNDGWTNRLYEPDPLVWNDYDAALIAAVLATEKANKSV